MPIMFLKRRTASLEIEKPTVAKATFMSPLATLTILFDGKLVRDCREFTLSDVNHSFFHRR
ncbi:MAG: hypothetical protein ACI92G_001403 [Candidatus Pelagisphaera sp.]|jgi:hypothetical protein